ncbi:hypothetical protein DEE53_25785, partial [Ralstonia pickettii]|uniref:hypothetical protein n=1 Tax=Ralstonia pickettii TaxID=329 RepID=UPI001C719BF2
LYPEAAAGHGRLVSTSADCGKRGHYPPNLIEGLSLIKQDALRRTMGLDGDPSALQHRGKILIRYIFEWDKPAIAYINLPMWLVLLFAASSAVLLITRSSLDRRDYALAVAYIFSLLGPVSWFVLAKQHSANHTHINYVLWYMPTFFLGCLCIGAGGRGGCQNFRSHLQRRSLAR